MMVLICWLIAAKPPSFTLGSPFSFPASRDSATTASWSLTFFHDARTRVLCLSLDSIDGACVW
jgi:hypothetical protein